MTRIVRAITLVALACTAVSTAIAQDARPWPQCASAPRCSVGRATCTAQGPCVIPTKRPHRGCLQYSCIKKLGKAPTTGGAGSVAPKPCSGGNDGCGGPYGPTTTSGGAGTVPPKPRPAGPDPNIDYGGAATCGPGSTGRPPNCSTLIK